MDPDDVRNDETSPKPKGGSARPLGISDRTWRVIQQAEQEEELARIKEEQQSLEAALKLVHDDEEAAKRRENEEAFSRGLAQMLQAEQQEYLRRVQLEEKATMELLERERRERERELQTKTYSCGICFDNLTIDKMYTLDECSHRFCFDCLLHHVEARISEGAVDRAKCPNPACPHVLSFAEMKHILPRDLFAKYDAMLLTKTLEKDPNLRYCPRPGCSCPMLTNSGSKLLCMMVCPKCKFTFCTNCMVEWHGDATCEQYQAWVKENSEADSRFDSWAQAHTKKCPKCNSSIEKNGGCNHMTCSKCHHEFCWTCLRDYATHGTCEAYS